MATTTLSVHRTSAQTLTSGQFDGLAEVPPEIEWFANLTNANTRRAYRQDLADFMAFAGLRHPEQFRHITRAHVIAWREQLAGQGLANDTIRRKLAALSSLYAYLCDRNAVLHNPVLGVKRPRSMNRDGVTPALGDHQARMLLEAPPEKTLKGKRDRAILATLLYHGLRCEELCTLKVGDIVHSQNIRTRASTGGYVSSIAYGLACLPLDSHPYSASRGTAKAEGEAMHWKHLLAYITGTVDQELLRRNEYLVTEHRILRNQITGRVRLTDGERKTLAELGQKLGKEALKEVATIVKPDTILGWHRKLVAQKFDGSLQRKAPGRPMIDPELEALVVRMAQENRSWGYDRIVGALANLGYTISDQTVGNIRKRQGLPPAPERRKTTTWQECIRTHLDVLVATDFFTAEIWTLGGFVTYDVLCFIHLGSRQVHIAGITPYPNEAWMVQVARNVTMEEWGFLSPGQYLIHDRDGKYCPAFQQIIDAAGVTRVPLPPRSPNLNAYAERWVRSIKEECLSRLILCGEASLRHALTHYVEHFHHERNHQGKGNVLLFPTVSQDRERAGPMQCRERLGGLLKYYAREAA